VDVGAQARYRTIGLARDLHPSSHRPLARRLSRAFRPNPCPQFFRSAVEEIRPPYVRGKTRRSGKNERVSLRCGHHALEFARGVMNRPGKRACGPHAVRAPLRMECSVANRVNHIGRKEYASLFSGRVRCSATSPLRRCVPRSTDLSPHGITNSRGMVLRPTRLAGVLLPLLRADSSMYCRLRSRTARDFPRNNSRHSAKMALRRWRDFVGKVRQ